MREEQLHKLQARSPRRELNRDVQRGVAERVLRVHDGLCAARLRALQKQLEDVKGALPNAEVQQRPPRRGLLPSVHSPPPTLQGLRQRARHGRLFSCCVAGEWPAGHQGKVTQ